MTRARAGCSTLWPPHPKADACRRPPSWRRSCAISGPIWPSRLELGGVPLGDCWRHPALTTGDATTGLVPLHKLSQWLAYSLIEPLQAAGIEVTDIDGLTGLAEYRNGGLLVDTGVLQLRDPQRSRSRARRRLDARRRMARAHGGAARPARGDGARRGWARTPPPSRWPRSCRAERGRPAARSRARAAPTARRRSRSSATARFSEAQASGMPMEGVTVVEHPLVQHKLTLIRDKDRSTKSFRELLKEIGMLLCYEVTRDLPLTSVEIETPLVRTTQRRDRRQEAGVRARAARRRDLRGGHARPGADGAGGAHRPLSRARDVRGGGVFLQGAGRHRRASRHRRRAGARHRQHGGRRHRPAQGARRQGHPLRVPAGRAAGLRAAARHPSRRADLDGRHRRRPRRARLHPARPRRRRRPRLRHAR